MNIRDVIAAQGQSMSIQQLQEMLAKAQAQQAPVPSDAPSIETVIAAPTVQPTSVPNTAALHPAVVVEPPAVIDTTAKPEPQYNEAGVRLPGKKAPRTKAELEPPDATAKPEPQYNAEGVRLPGKKAPRTRRTKAELEAAALVEITPQKLLCACASGGVSPEDAERYLAILEGLSD